MNFFLFQSFIIIHVMKSNCQFTCDPVHDCKYAEEDDMVPDPEDCEKYYVCVILPSSNTTGPSSESIKCPDGMYFDQTNATCSAETIHGACTNQCDLLNHCITECPVLFVRYIAIANASDCSYLSICMPDGSAARARCPEDTPYFNGNECVSDESQCCNFCFPYCNNNFTPIADPCDCTSYYNCDEVGPAYDFNRKSCEDGYYFDEDFGWCLYGECESLCTCF